MKNYTVLKEIEAIAQFLSFSTSTLSFHRKLKIIGDFLKISNYVDCPHTQVEIIAFVRAILSLDSSIPGCIVEAGCYKGGSTAKFSIPSHIINRSLIVFDSFKGLPSHQESHKKNIFGKSVTFSPGEYKGSISEVRKNVERFGEIRACKFIEGWFDNTMPEFKEPIAAIYLDVDLVKSTSTCLKYLYPLLQNGGYLYSQDGHLPLVIELFNDESFWREEVKAPKPTIHGLGTSKLIFLQKVNDS